MCTGMLILKVKSGKILSKQVMTPLKIWKEKGKLKKNLNTLLYIIKKLPT